MSSHCHDACHTGLPAVDPRYRKILWIALLVNLAMFGVEFAGGWQAESLSLLADAVDFFGDAVNYGLSLWVLAGPLLWRSRTALFKGLTMGVYALFVLGRALWSVQHGAMPEPVIMGVIGTLALLANCWVAWLLFHYRDGDANMRSVWLCTRNDALGNIAVLLAALGVFGSGGAWPDLAVAAVMGLLGLTAAWQVIRQARRELALARLDRRETR